MTFNKRSWSVGNRITAALIFLNAIGFLGCLILLAAASGQVPDIAIRIIRAMNYSLQMFVFGAVLPVIIWSIAASEINRSNVKVKLIEDWARYFLLFASGVLFFVAASRLPNSIISSFGRDGELSSMRERFGSVQFWGAVGLPERRGSGRLKRHHKSSVAVSALSPGYETTWAKTVRDGALLIWAILAASLERRTERANGKRNVPKVAG